MKKVLSIAGSDSCGGAGIQADLKTMSALGVYGMSVIVAVTAQNTTDIFGVQEISEKLISSQIKTIFNDIKVDAVKIGMLSSSKIIQTVLKNLKQIKPRNIVLDTVMISKSGYKLLKDEAIQELTNIFPFATLVTPNILEAEVLSEIKINNEERIKEAAQKIQKQGAKNVLLKGGHRQDNNCTDILLLENGEFIQFEGTKIPSNNTHGTGCTLSSAIASHLALGFNLEDSIKKSKEYINKAIKNSFTIGKGVEILGFF